MEYVNIISNCLKVGNYLLSPFVTVSVVCAPLYYKALDDIVTS